jgi:hypothetical protein
MGQLLDMWQKNVLIAEFDRADPTCQVCKKAAAIAYETVQVGPVRFAAGDGHCSDCYAKKLNKGEEEEVGK